MAVLTLIASSNFTGDCTGRLACARAFENAVDVGRRALELVRQIHTIRQEASIGGVKAIRTNCRQSISRRQFEDVGAMCIREGFADNDKTSPTAIASVEIAFSIPAVS